MKILVINSGSSSVKISLIETESKETLFKAHVDGIGRDDCLVIFNHHFKEDEHKEKIDNHEQAIEVSIKEIVESGLIQDKSEINVIGHRVVHGGNKFVKPTIMNSDVLNDLKEIEFLAPLHNPHNIKGIEVCTKIFPGARQIAVFDTAFHSTIPEEAFTYALPKNLVDKYSIRRYGFHGTSHKYVSKKAGDVLKAMPEKIVTCHMGNGISFAAVKDGKSVDTTMGMTPLEGMPMGTRSGTIDPQIITFLQKNENLSAEDIDQLLNKKSGLLGIASDNDMRSLYARSKENDHDAILAMNVLCYKAAFFIGGYAAAMNGLDCIVFTGGMGEKAFYLREKVCGYLSHLGVELDSGKNEKNDEIVSSDNSGVKVMVIPTNEELQIAMEAEDVVG